MPDLVRAAEDISRRYRREGDSGTFQIESESEAYAYMAARMPATYAVNQRILLELQKIYPLFSPVRVLDVGAGPATASLSASQFYPSIASIELLEVNQFFVSIGQRVMSDYIRAGRWMQGGLHQIEKNTKEERYDLVLCSYVLNEIPLSDIEKTVEKLLSTCSDTIIIIEPGTPHGAEIIGKVRAWAAITKSIDVLAPCSHTGACPLQEYTSRWCHFSVRTSRSKLHKALKGGDLGYEDEKFSYIILSRQKPAEQSGYRVIGNPTGTKIRELQICGKNGAETLRISKSHPLYKRAKKVEWGDSLESE